MLGILINFSGHALSDHALGMLATKFETVVSSKPIQFNFEVDVEAQLVSILKALPVEIDGRRPLTLIPPGQSTLAILLISYIHGVIGHFPSLCYLERSEDGVYVPKVEYILSAQAIRSNGRAWRAEKFAVQHKDSDDSLG